VDTFYDRIKQHNILGPIFDNAIGGNWPTHLARMKDFWASVSMNAGRYSGKPVPAHRQHGASIQEWHFGIWLGLFRQTLEDTAPTPEAVDYIMERAERIAKRALNWLCSECREWERRVMGSQAVFPPAIGLICAFTE